MGRNFDFRKGKEIPSSFQECDTCAGICDWDRHMKAESSKKPLILTIILVSIYSLVILLLLHSKVLTRENAVLSVTTALGWLVALWIALIHLDRARRDNQAAKKYEIKKRLEIEAFKEVNKAINEYSGKITSIMTLFFYTLPSKLELHIKNPKLFKFDLVHIDQEIGITRANLYEGNAKFLLTIEANEIAIIEYDHYRKYINFRTDDLYKLLDDFFEYFYSLNIDNLNNKQVFLEFKKKCAPIHELAQDILSYLFDYRILLMNSMLVDIFDKSVPSRRPSDPKYKLLTDVAIKEEVEKEEEKRIKAAMKKP